MNHSIAPTFEMTTFALCVGILLGILAVIAVFIWYVVLKDNTKYKTTQANSNFNPSMLNKSSQDTTQNSEVFKKDEEDVVIGQE